MTGKERWNAIFKFKKFDRIFNCEFGWWTDTLKRWHKEGLPEEIDTNEKGDRYFNFDNKLLHEIEKHKIRRDNLTR